MSDYAGIQALIVRQKRLTDVQDEAGVSACWSPHKAGLSVSLNGKVWTADGHGDVMAAALLAWRSGRHGGKYLNLHFLGPIEVIPHGDAQAEAYYTCLYVSTDPGGFKVLGFGEYHDEVWLEEGGWRIGMRRVRQVVADGWPGAPPRSEA